MTFGGIGSIGNVVPNDRGGMARRVADLERKINELEHAQSGNAMTIDGPPGVTIKGGGALRVIDPSTGTSTVYVGQLGFNDGSGRVQGGLVFRRADGTAAFGLADNGTVPGHDFQQNLAWFDKTGHIVVAEDGDGNGIANPYIPLGQWTSNNPPLDTTTSASFTTLQTCGGYRQHPRIALQCLVRCSDGTTAGQVRVIDGTGAAVGAVTSVAAGSFTYINFPTADLAGDFGSAVVLSLQARRTAGAGTIGAAGTLMIGVQA